MKTKNPTPTVRTSLDGRTSVSFPNRFRLELTPRQFDRLQRKVRAITGRLTPWDRKDDRWTSITQGGVTLYLTSREAERFAELLEAVQPDGNN